RICLVEDGGAPLRRFLEGHSGRSYLLGKQAEAGIDFRQTRGIDECLPQAGRLARGSGSTQGIKGAWSAARISIEFYAAYARRKHQKLWIGSLFRAGPEHRSSLHIQARSARLPARS